MATKLLGIDYGGARVGIALAEPPAPPQPLITLPNSEKLIAAIEGLIAEHGVNQVVVGLPRGLDGQVTAQTATAKRFASNLEQALGHKVALQDEAGTSVVAKERLGGRAQLQPELIDQEAAVIILEDFLMEVQ